MTVEFTVTGGLALEEALSFLIEQGASVETTEKVRDDILSSAMKLGSFPRMGTIEEYLSEDPEEHRWVKARDHYKIIYYIDEEKSTVRITDVFDTRQDPSEMQG